MGAREDVKRNSGGDEKRGESEAKAAMNLTGIGRF